ncbi:hypothetical protein [Dyella sp.]|uniref:hypothetical protein n=1 Tax=Dyella sp. TaxID=1869338 RepID=UPI002ED4E667
MYRKLITALTCLILGQTHANTPAPFVHSMDLPFNQYSWVAAHNAFNRNLTPVPNQSLTMAAQLQAGVRGLMLDLVQSGNEVRLCHSVCLGGEERLENALKDTIMPFLASNSDAVVTLLVEGEVPRAMLHTSFNRVPGLANATFKPGSWNTSQWPTLRQMKESGQRLLIFHLNSSMAGDYELNSGTAHVMASTQGTVENYWSLGDTIFSHDYSCKSRWDNIPLASRSVTFPGKSWDRLFVMNQFHGVSLSAHSRQDNRFDKLLDRHNNHCFPAAQRIANYIAIDHIEQGDGLPFAGVLSQGGVIFYEGNRAMQNIVCGIPGRVTININTQNDSLGCENDEARSARIVGLPAGTRISIYDSPSGSTSDDYTIITLRRNIEDLVIPTFQQNVNNADIEMVFRRHNGLDGKVSRIKIEPPG